MYNRIQQMQIKHKLKILISSQIKINQREVVLGFGLDDRGSITVSG